MASTAWTFGSGESGALHARAPWRLDPGKSWQWLVLRGVLALMLGVAAILFPLGALFAFTLVFAAYAFVDGLFSIISGIGERKRERFWWAQILRGLVGVAAGALFVAMPLIATISYALVTVVLLAAWAMLAGALEISAAIRLRKEIEGEWLLGLSGALTILLGLAMLVLLAVFPGASLVSAAWIIGVYAMAAGIVLIAQGVRLRRIVLRREARAAGEEARAATA